MNRWTTTLGCSALLLLSGIGKAASQSEAAPPEWAVGTWSCVRTSNDLPAPPGSPVVADVGFTSRFDVTLQADGRFSARGSRSDWTGPVFFSATGSWRGNDRYWLATGESTASRDAGMPAIVDAGTGEIVQAAREPESWTAPFETGGQRMMDRVVNARAGEIGPGGIESFTVCRRPD